MSKSKRSKQRRGKSLSPETQLQRAQRTYEKGQWKQALKEAKVCYRDHPEPPQRQLLERAYLARIRDLQRSNNIEQARDAAKELLKLDPVLVEVRSELPRLQLSLGMVSVDQVVASECAEGDHRELLTELVDEALIHPKRQVSLPAELKAEVAKVHEALRRIEQGDEQAALEQLQDIPRKSPLADWRFFARGLNAFYDKDQERYESNWSRLDKKRPAFRIAQTLLVHRGKILPADAEIDVANSVRRLEFGTQANPALSALTTLAENAKNERWQDVTRAFRAFRQRYGSSQGALVEKMTDVIWKSLLMRGRLNELQQFFRKATPPPSDPHWHRARALLNEHSAQRAPNAVEELWQACIDDLPKITIFNDEQRKIASALMHYRLADDLLDCGRSFARFSRHIYGGDEHSDERVTAQFQKSIDNLNKSIKSWPELIESHQKLAEVYLEMDRPLEAAKAYTDLLQYFPKDYDALSWLVHYHLENDSPDEAAPFASRALEVRPRDPKSQMMVWNQRVGMVRYLMKKKRKPDLAREELETAIASAPANLKPFWLDLLRAAVEFKAKADDAGQRYLQKVIDELEEPAVAWMIMQSHAVRFSLPRPLKKDFQDRCKQSLEQPPTSFTIGQISKFLQSIVANKVKYTGLTTHQRLFRNYLEAASGVNLKWQSPDLKNACEYLVLSKNWRDQNLASQLAAIGIQHFRKLPTFHFLYAKIRFETSTWSWRAEEIFNNFEEALRLNENSTSCLTADEVDFAKNSMLKLADYVGFDYEGGFSRLGGDDEEFEDYEDDDDDYEDDDYEDDGYEGDYEFAFDNDGGGFGDAMSFATEMAFADIDPQQLEDVIAEMPAELRKQFDAFVKMLGVPPAKALQLMLATITSGGFDDLDTTGAAPNKTSRKSRKKSQTGKDRQRDLPF